LTGSFDQLYLLATVYAPRNSAQSITSDTLSNPDSMFLSYDWESPLVAGIAVRKPGCLVTRSASTCAANFGCSWVRVDTGWGSERIAIVVVDIANYRAACGLGIGVQGTPQIMSAAVQGAWMISTAVVVRRVRPMRILSAALISWVATGSDHKYRVCRNKRKTWEDHVC
jgi:hypothetical protein